MKQLYSVRAGFAVHLVNGNMYLGGSVVELDAQEAELHAVRIEPASEAQQEAWKIHQAVIAGETAAVGAEADAKALATAEEDARISAANAKVAAKQVKEVKDQQQA